MEYRRYGAAVLAAAMCLLTLTGCQLGQGEETTPKDPPLTISIGFWNAQDALIGDDVQRYVEEKFNVDLVPVNMNYENYTTILQQLASYNQLPDIFASDIVGTSAYESWIDQKRIRALPEDLEQYPNLQKYIEQPYMQMFRYSDGNFYALPRMTYPDEDLWALDRCIIVRRDWMEKLGLEEPQNWEDFENILRAFVEDDPDGNGEDDTSGLTAVNMSLLETVYLNEFPELCYTERGWMYEDEKWIPVYCSKHTKDALQLMQNPRKDNLLDSDLAYTSRPKAAGDFIEGRTGAICIQYTELLDEFSERGMLSEAHNMIQVLKPWPAQDGNRYRFTTSLHWSESYFSANVDEEKMERILQIYDWLLSPEFDTLLTYGLEGIDYTLDGDTYCSLDPNQPSPIVKYPSLTLFSKLVEWNQDKQYELTEANINRFGEENIRYAQELLEWYKENTLRVPYNDEIKFMSLPYKNNLVNNYVIQDRMLGIIFGEEPAVTAWPKALEELAAITPLREAIAEVTAQAEVLGLTTE